jgi:hypothetical protein
MQGFPGFLHHQSMSSILKLPPAIPGAKQNKKKLVLVIHNITNNAMEE